MDDDVSCKTYSIGHMYAAQPLDQRMVACHDQSTHCTPDAPCHDGPAPLPPAMVYHSRISMISSNEFLAAYLVVPPSLLHLSRQRILSAASERQTPR
jgi:hypothetical protein